MEKNEYHKCCMAIEEGEEILVENLTSHKQGRVIYCQEGQFDVKVGGRREAWLAANCKEVSSSSESPHSNL